MSKNVGTVRSVSYDEEFLEAWGLEKPILKNEGVVVMEVAFYGLDVLQDLKFGDIVQIEKKG